MYCFWLIHFNKKCIIILTLKLAKTFSICWNVYEVKIHTRSVIADQCVSARSQFVCVTLFTLLYVLPCASCYVMSSQPFVIALCMWCSLQASIFFLLAASQRFTIAVEQRICANERGVWEGRFQTNRKSQCIFTWAQCMFHFCLPSPWFHVMTVGKWWWATSSVSSVWYQAVTLWMQWPADTVTNYIRAVL